MDLFKLQAQIEVGIENALNKLAQIGSKANDVANDIKEGLGGKNPVNLDSSSAEKALKTLTSTIDKQEKELKDLKTRYKEVCEEQGDSSNEAQKLAKEIDDLSRELNDNKNALEDAKKAVDRYGKELDEVGEQANKSSSKFSKFFGALGKGIGTAAKVVGVGIGAMATAIGGLTVKAVASAGELEQNMGGSEAVFGKHAKGIQKTAEEAFSKMGLSTSDYLATANKMGALFQGAGFDIKESMTLSQDAMQRAADVASIMGIDTASAMEAVAGAAKGNFTMMDNLGVAMNETTLANYALEKGMKKSYNEMTQQEKIGVAMEMFLDKTSYAAGNYAKENETLAGSLGTAKAALNNFLSGSGKVEDVVSSFTKAGEVIAKNVTELFPKLITGLIQIVNGLIPQIPSLLGQLLKPLIEGATSLIKGVVSALPQLVEILISALPSLLDGVISIINLLIQSLPSLVGMICSALPTLIPLLIDGLVSIIVTLCEQFSSIIQPIIDHLPDIIISIVEALCNNLPILIEGIITLILGIVSALPQLCMAIAELMPTILEMVISALLDALPLLLSGIGKLIVGIIEAFPQLVASLIVAVVGTFQVMWKKIKEVFKPVGNWFKDIFAKAKDGIVKAWSNIKDGFKKAWESIKKVFSNVGSWFKETFTKAKEAISKAWSSVKNFFSNIWSGIKNVFASVGNWFREKFNSAKNAITNAWSSVKNFFSDIWNGIKNVFANIGSWFREKFNSAKEGIFNIWSNVKAKFTSIKDGIVNAFSNVKERLTKPFTRARDEIKKVADKIKAFFKGELKMPKIKVPKFSIKPSGWKVGDLLEGKIPKLAITWAAKGGIFDNPTLFNTPTGALGVGEAGAEAVAPIDTLIGYVQQAVKAENSELHYSLDRLYKLLVDYMPIIANKNLVVALDGDVLVGQIAPRMDEALGEIEESKERGR